MQMLPITFVSFLQNSFIMNLTKIFSGSQNSLSSLNSLLRDRSAMSEGYTQGKVVGICSEAEQEIDLVADILLLQTATKPAVLEPLSKGDSKVSAVKDSIISTSKGILLSVKNLEGNLKEWYFQGVGEGVRLLTEEVIALTENAAQLAYITAVKDPHSQPALPGVTDRYSFEMSKFAISVACRKFEKEKASSLDTQLILKISSTVADSLTVLRDGCRRASELKDLLPADKEMFQNCSKSIQGTTAPFLASLKSFTKSRSSDDKQRCILFARPLVEAVRSTVEFSQLPEFRGTPAVLSEDAQEAQTAVLGSSMAVVSATIQLFASTRTLLEQPRFMNDSLWQRWHMCSKAVSEAISLLQRSVQEHTPLPSRRSQSSKVD